MKIKGLLLISFIIVITFTGCTLAGLELGFVGSWESTTSNIVIEFNSDDTGTFYNGSVKLRDFTVISADSILKEFTLKLDADGSTNDYIYELSWDTLELTDKYGTFEYEKQ